MGGMNWYEIWVEDGLAIPYILLVMPADGDAVNVLDPLNGNIVAYAASD